MADSCGIPLEVALNEAKCRWRPLPPASLILKSLALPPVQLVPFPLETSKAFFSLAQATISCLPRNPLGFLWLAYKAQSCLQSLETCLPRNPLGFPWLAYKAQSCLQSLETCLPRNPLGFLWLAYKAQSCLQSLETYLL